jgi:hypothetical protein
MSPSSSIGCIQNNLWAYGTLNANRAPILHLSCTGTNTVSKWTKMRFHMTHVTLEFHWMRPKWFLRLWYVRHKPCTYLASRLALSPNGLNRPSTWASSPRSTIGCIQNDFWAWGTFGANRAPILHRHKHCLRTDWNKILHDPQHQVVPSGAYKMIFEPLVCSTQIMHLSCVKVSTISKWTESRFLLSLVTLEYH